MKKTIKLVLRILIVALISGLIEVFVINFDYFLVKSKPDIESNIVLVTDDFTAYNWDNSNGQMVSLFDPILAVDYNGYIRSVRILPLVKGDLPYIEVFYSYQEDNGITSETQIMLDDAKADGSYCVELNKYVKILRIDLGDAEGLVLNDISVIINENVFNFSLARFVAMNLIYWFGVLLFAAQRPPKYNI